MAGLSPNSSHRSADAGHGDLLDEGSGAQQSTSTIEDVVPAVRTGTALSPN